MTINNIKEAELILAEYIPQVKELLGKDITLDRMVPLMDLLDNPQNKLRIIHVAGTSGKTSTAYYVASLLMGAGKRVGLTVSPHIDSITERVQIDLKPISEQQFCISLGEFLDIIKTSQLNPTYFEVLMAYAYWYFAKFGVDYAVIETGLGGLHDASNVATRSDKVCVITDIGLDHTHVLGRTLPKISTQKAGIIHDGNTVFMYSQSQEINDVVTQKATSKNAKLELLSQSAERQKIGNILSQNNLPIYQQRNWLLAYRTFCYVQQRDSLTDTNLVASLQIKVPGRMDVHTINGKTLIMDGAHNQQKMHAFVTSFQSTYPGQKAAVVLALKQDKEYEAVLPMLLPICSRLILTTFNALQDLPLKPTDPQLLANFAAQYGFTNVTILQNPIDACCELLASSEQLAVITGSFYLLSCIRPFIINVND